MEGCYTSNSVKAIMTIYENKELLQMEATAVPCYQCPHYYYVKREPHCSPRLSVVRDNNLF